MWYKTLQHLPEGVQLVDMKTSTIIFENKAICKITSEDGQRFTAPESKNIQVKTLIQDQDNIAESNQASTLEQAI